jgi:hypothetical protein
MKKQESQTMLRYQSWEQTTNCKSSREDLELEVMLGLSNPVLLEKIQTYLILAGVISEPNKKNWPEIVEVLKKESWYWIRWMQSHNFHIV